MEAQTERSLAPSRIPRLFLVPDCEDRYSILVNPVSGDIAAVAKVDEPFPIIFRKVIDHSTKTGMRTEYLHTLPYGFASPVRSASAFRAQEITQPLQIPDRCRGEYHLWHLGAGNSFSVSQLASH